MRTKTNEFWLVGIYILFGDVEVNIFTIFKLTFRTPKFFF